MVFDYEGCERYYCVECCARRPRNRPIDVPSIWTALLAAVEHVRNEHKGEGFNLVFDRRMDEIAKAIAKRRRELRK